MWRDTLHNGGKPPQMGWAEELLNKVVIFVYLVQKKSILVASENTFMDLGTFQLCNGLWRVRELSDFINNILICVLKMNKGLTGLERQEGEQLMIIFIFGWTIPLTLEAIKN